MKVPFLNLQAQYNAIAEEVAHSLHEVLASCAFSGGPFVEKFEEEFARFCGCREAIGVGNGTDALWLALAALGVGGGDEVVTVPNSFIATAEAISLCGATPVFVDVDEVSYTMDPALLEGAITPRTKAIIPVHLFGQMADMDPIMEIAARHGIPVVEDACQAHGAQYKGRRAGSIGAAGCFSFYPGKNLGAYGEAGCVTTSDPLLAAKIRMIRDHGQSRKYHHELVGVNARMDGIQGAVLSVKLKYLPAWNEARARHAASYRELLGRVSSLLLPTEMPYARHVYHVYAVRHPGRDPLLEALGVQGISCGVHYPVPIHLQTAYASLGLGEGSFPVAERCAREYLSLPMFPELTPEQIAHVAEALTILAGGGTGAA
ncbi:DegT/DnrJ/EryC1/StrS family aminotransferase [Geomonas sp. RF6]|uniref:DegT/DnrJ/EryC1/StrS family aminotransferase n=1 Tax=Geomonas sp. RF6 TaxID=2897342 RepID=UPI001E380D0E|nr:DegT/DnrJ/EryC1/StrS family aminotransferase [Geomonas sp. RF6]UFS71102.1 DegT/DnrJ/EryC1/StrS family aminotransferase [Geomonas sp. RF6]